MGTEIITEDNCYVKRYWGGKDKGVSFQLNINKSFTQKEFAEFLSKCIERIIVE